MKLKTALGIAVIAVGGVAGSIAITIQSIDLNEVRELIIGRVEAETGRSFRIDGNLRFVLSLRPALVAESVILANAAWGSRAEMVKLDRLVVVVKFLPLLSGDVQVRRLRLEGADILLETDKSGRGNWEFGAGPDGGSTVQPEDEERFGTSLGSLSRIDIKDSLITFLDGVSRDSRRIDVKELRITANNPEDPIDLELHGALDGQVTELSGTIGNVAALKAGGRLPVDLAGKIGDTDLRTSGVLTQPLDHRSFTVEVLATGGNLAEFGQLIHVSLPSWRDYSLAFKLGEKDGALSFGNVRAKVGQSDATGQLTLAIDGERPRLDGALSSTLIDLSDLDESREESIGRRSDGRIFSDKTLPHLWLKSLDGALTLTAEKMVKGEATFTDLKVDATLDNGRLEIVGAKAGASGGTVSLNGSVDGSKKPPVVTFKGQAHQVDAGTLLRMLDLSDVLRGGKADIRVDVSSQGRSLHQIMASLAGTASWSMVGGSIDDNFARILLADLSGILRAGSGGGQLTCLAARFTAKSGIARTQALVIDTRAASIFGSGSVNLGRETIKMHFDPAAKQTSLAALAVPVDVTGPLADPNVTPDPLGVAETALGAASTIAGDVFDLLGEVAGAGGSNNGSGGCVMALDASAKSKPTKQKSTGEQILDDTGDVIEDIGKGIGDLFD